jgi:hypothetical protein
MNEVVTTIATARAGRHTAFLPEHLRTRHWESTMTAMLSINARLGWPSAGILIQSAQAFHQLSPFQGATEVLFVQTDAGHGLDGPLQDRQGESFGHDLENDRAVFELAPQAGQGCGQNASVI